MQGDWGGRRSGGHTGSVPLRPGRSGEAGGRDSPGRAGEEQRVMAPPTQGQGACWAPRPIPCPPNPPPGCMGPWGHRREAREIRRRRREGPSQTGGAGEERRVFAMPTQAQEECWAPRWGPCSLRPGVGGTPQPLLFLEPKPHAPHSLGPFAALWALSIGPAHHPNLTLA